MSFDYKKIGLISGITIVCMGYVMLTRPLVLPGNALYAHLFV